MKKILKIILLILFLDLFFCPEKALAYMASISYSSDYSTINIDYTKNGTNYHYVIPRPIIYNPTFTATHNTYWVSTTGSDSNPGTQSLPFQTISHAVDLSVNGDVIYVKAGSYVDSPHFYHENGNVVLSAAPGDIGKVYLSAPASYYGQDKSIITVQGDGNTQNWVTINGFIVQGYRDIYGPVTDLGASGIHFQNMGSGYVYNNVSYANEHCGLKEQGHGGTFTAIGNVFFDNGVSGTPRDHGIYSPSNDAVLSGNISFNNTGWGIHSFDSGGHGLTNQTIDHNVTFGNGWAGILMNGSNSKINHNTAAYNSMGMEYYGNTAFSNTVIYNIFAFNTNNNEFMTPEIPSNSNTDDYNVFYPHNYADDPNPLIGLGTHELYVDPQFVNPTIGDYRLKSSSLVQTYGAYTLTSSTKTGIPQLRSLLQSFVLIFDYNKLVEGFGK